MGRLAVLLLAGLLLAPSADARTPLRKCRKACKPLVSTACPAKGRALRKCRRGILRECRRDGIATCAFGLPTGGPGDGTTAPTPTSSTLPPSVTTTTTTLPGGSSTTATVPGSASTTTTLPAPVAAVAGNWGFAGALTQSTCSTLDYDIISSLAVQQDGATLYGTMEGRAAAGAAGANGWSFEWNVGNLQAPEATCAQRFVITVSAATSPAAADATATASCTDGSACQAHWVGSVTREP